MYKIKSFFKNHLIFILIVYFIGTIYGFETKMYVSTLKINFQIMANGNELSNTF